MAALASVAEGEANKLKIHDVDSVMQATPTHGHSLDADPAHAPIAKNDQPKALLITGRDIELPEDHPHTQYLTTSSPGTSQAERFITGALHNISRCDKPKDDVFIDTSNETFKDTSTTDGEAPRSLALATPASTTIASMVDEISTIDSGSVQEVRMCCLDHYHDESCEKGEGTAFVNNKIESVCSDGDLLLHIRYHRAGTDTPVPPVLSLRVSSVVLRLASAPLRELLDTPVDVVGGSITKKHIVIDPPTHRHQLKPRIWGHRQGKGMVSLTIQTTCPPDDLRDTLLLLFKIIHLNPGCSTPSILQIALIAELGWILGCMRPIEPLIKFWLQQDKATLSNFSMAEKEVRLVAEIVLGFVLGDKGIFEKASLEWLLHSQTKDFEKWEKWSLYVIPTVHDDLRRKRFDVFHALSTVVSDILRGYCNTNKQPDSTTAYILGAFLTSLSTICPTAIVPYLVSPSTTIAIPDRIPRVQLHLHWKLQHNLKNDNRSTSDSDKDDMVDDKDDDNDDQSIASLTDNLLTITRHLRTLLNKDARGYNATVLPFAQKIVDELEKLQGLHLDEYRGKMDNLIDLGNCIRGNIRMGLADHTGLGELRIYAKEKIDENEAEKQEKKRNREKQEKEKQERERWQRDQQANWIMGERTRQIKREREFEELLLENKVNWRAEEKTRRKEREQEWGEFLEEQKANWIMEEKTRQQKREQEWTEERQCLVIGAVVILVFTFIMGICAGGT